MNFDFTTLGAISGLVIAIILIIRKIHPAYGLIFGALLGGIIGSLNLDLTLKAMISGTQTMMPTFLRILDSGILAGALIKTGSAEKIANTIILKFKDKHSIIAISLSTMIICAAGVFIDIAVITVAPIALSIGKKLNYNVSCILIALIGGSKAGNIISPNPNTIVIAETFNVDLTSLMAMNIIPAIASLIVTVCIASTLNKKKGAPILSDNFDYKKSENLPSFFMSISGPLMVILLLSLRPLFSINIDPIVALPIGGIVCCIACKQFKFIKDYSTFGLNKVLDIAIIMTSTGALAGIINASSLQSDISYLLNYFSIPAFILAPLSGILFAAATGSTTAGATISSNAFASTLISANIPALSAAAMLHTGCIVIDTLPHASYFHITGGIVNMSIKDRIKLIPYEACIGFASTIFAVLIYLIFR